MLVDTQKLIAPQQFHVNLVIFVHEPLESMIKNTYLTEKITFLVIFRHFSLFSPCERMRKHALAGQNNNIHLSMHIFMNMTLLLF